MSRRLRRLTGAGMLAALLLVGCGGKKSIAFTTVNDISTLPSGISSSIVLVSHASGGYISLEDADSIYVCVSLAGGVMPMVDSAVRDGSTIRVSVKEQAIPPTGSAASYTVIKLPASENTAVMAVDANGVEYPPLAIGTGSYTRQVDDWRIEIRVDDSPYVFWLSAAAQSQFSQLAANYLDLKTNDQIRFCHYRYGSLRPQILYIAKIS